VVAGTPVRPASSPIDNNVGVADEARACSLVAIDFKPTRSAWLV
jgi:hypothetical protein